MKRVLIPVLLLVWGAALAQGDLLTQFAQQVRDLSRQNISGTQGTFNRSSFERAVDALTDTATFRGLFELPERAFAADEDFADSQNRLRLRANFLRDEYREGLRTVLDRAVSGNQVDLVRLERELGFLHSRYARLRLEVELRELLDLNLDRSRLQLNKSALTSGLNTLLMSFDDFLANADRTNLANDLNELLGIISLDASRDPLDIESPRRLERAIVIPLRRLDRALLRDSIEDLASELLAGSNVGQLAQIEFSREVDVLLELFRRGSIADEADTSIRRTNTSLFQTVDLSDRFLSKVRELVAQSVSSGGLASSFGTRYDEEDRLAEAADFFRILAEIATNAFSERSRQFDLSLFLNEADNLIEEFGDQLFGTDQEDINEFRNTLRLLVVESIVTAEINPRLFEPSFAQLLGNLEQIAGRR